jgi:hypothetical protein
MAKKPKYHIDIYIDKLTNSIENTISGDSFATQIHESALKDIKGANKKNGWNFNWQAEFKTHERTLGATFIGGQKMIIFPNSAIKLINKYFKI